MLAFYSSHYTLGDLTALHGAINAAQLNLHCSSINCDFCPHNEACADLIRLECHIARKIKEMEATVND